MRLASPAVLIVLAVSACTSSSSDSGSGHGAPAASVLVFSRTSGYRHASIEDGVAALTRLAIERRWHLESTEDSAKFTDESLAPFDVVVFLSTTGDVLDAAQQGAFERFIQSGRGFVGVHAASDTEYDWPWYGALVGAYFRTHAAVQSASLRPEGGHPAIEGVPTPWTRVDEWYAFQTNPRSKVEVLLTLDESSYEPGDGAMGADHPVAWLHSYDGGRAFYTALGHTPESYAEELFLQHLTRGIEWAAGGE